MTQAAAATRRNTPAAMHRLFEAVAAIVGVAAGALLAEPVAAAAVSAWNGFFLPAYDALIKNGLLAWCM